MTVDAFCDDRDIEVPLLEPRSLYDAALVGVIKIGDEHRALYDYEAAIQMTMAKESWTRRDTSEWFSYNVESGMFAFLVWHA